MSSAEVVEIRTREELDRNTRLYCCLFDVEFFGLRSRLWFDSYISLSRSWEVSKAVVNNGRVVAADHLKLTITEQDWLIICQFYEWDEIAIGTFRRYKRDYLPRDFVASVLALYADKTKLKGIEGAETDYMKAKEMLNSCYGMTVTDIVRPEFVYSGEEWTTKETTDYDKEITKYNRNRGRFLFYPWGVWVTAYARRNLFSGVLEFGGDYIYSDTDSVKVRNVDRHVKYLTDYNRTIQEQLLTAVRYHGFNPELISPSTITGESKPLGVWDFDGEYSDFKTLGAKRYMVRYADDDRNPKAKRGKVSLTVSGLNKQVCVPYLLNKYGEEGIFNAFTDDLYIPGGYTGKNTHTYIDDERTGVIVDYTGKPGEYRELSGVHLEEADYSLSLSREYVNYIMSIDTIEI